MRKGLDCRRISDILSINARMFFSEPARTRALNDVWIKSRYVLSLVEVAERISLDLTKAKILDVGCSKCDLLLALRGFGARNLIGLNLFPYDLKYLNSDIDIEEYFGNSAGKIKYVVCDTDKKPFHSRAPAMK